MSTPNQTPTVSHHEVMLARLRGKRLAPGCYEYQGLYYLDWREYCQSAGIEPTEENQTAVRKLLMEDLAKLDGFQMHGSSIIPLRTN